MPAFALVDGECAVYFKIYLIYFARCDKINVPHNLILTYKGVLCHFLVLPSFFVPCMQKVVWQQSEVHYGGALALRAHFLFF